MKKTENFNFEKAKDGAALVSRSGYPVTIYTFDRRSTAYPIVGAINYPNYDHVATWTPQGKAARLLDKPHDNDLLLCVENCE